MAAWSSYGPALGSSDRVPYVQSVHLSAVHTECCVVRCHVNRFGERPAAAFIGFARTASRSYRQPALRPTQIIFKFVTASCRLYCSRLTAVKLRNDVDRTCGAWGRKWTNFDSGKKLSLRSHRVRYNFINTESESSAEMAVQGHPRFADNNDDASRQSVPLLSCVACNLHINGQKLRHTIAKARYSLVLQAGDKMLCLKLSKIMTQTISTVHDSVIKVT